MIQRLREWLIALVREAVRAEMDHINDVIAVPNPKSAMSFTGLSVPSFTSGAINNREPLQRVRAGIKVQQYTEPSFESMQAQALKAQEEHYAESE